MNEERQIESAIDRLMKMWPVLFVIGTGVAGYMKLYWEVQELKKGQERWQTGSEQRRERNHEEIDDIKNRLTKLEMMAQCRGK